MKISTTAICVTLSLMVSSSVYACGFHGGDFGGAYGMQWRAYNPNAELEAAKEYNTETEDNAAEQATKKARPVFSNSATRASASAKILVASGDSESTEEAEEADQE